MCFHFLTMIKWEKTNFFLGDIIISYNYMNQPKNISNLNFKNKVVKIFIHGFLHLLGFDHKKNSDFNKMQREENKLFNLLEKKIEKNYLIIKKSYTL